MLIRIVRMTFKPEHQKSFQTLFETHKYKIRAFDGCRHLELLQDTQSPHIFVTYSLWESEEHLNAYRHAPLFEEVWSQTKAMFAEKPLAFSNMKVDEVM